MLSLGRGVFLVVAALTLILAAVRLHGEELDPRLVPEMLQTLQAQIALQQKLIAVERQDHAAALRAARSGPAQDALRWATAPVLMQ